MRTAVLPLLLLPGLSCAQEPLPVLLVSGANNHDWNWTAQVLREALEETLRFRVTLTLKPADELRRPLLLQHRAVVLDYNGPRWGAAAEEAFLEAVRAGTGVVVVHAANNAFPGWTDYERLVGLCWREGAGHGSFHPFDVHVVDRSHPVTAGMADLRQHPDELYHGLVHMHGAEFRVLLSAFSDPKTGGSGRHEPMATAGRFGEGRVFHTALGHVWRDVPQTRASLTDPQFRRLLARGTEWAATGAVTLAPEPWNWMSEPERKEGFELLFDGRTLAGWRAWRGDGPPAQGWTVRGAALVCEGEGGVDLVSERRYGEFDLRFDWRAASGGDSGVLFWVQETGAAAADSGPEYQIVDAAQAVDAAHRPAALLDLAGVAAGTIAPAGTWHQGRIVVQRGTVQHWLDGSKLVDLATSGAAWDERVAGSRFRDRSFARVREGHLALQAGSGTVAFRNLRIRRL